MAQTGFPGGSHSSKKNALFDEDFWSDDDDESVNSLTPLESLKLDDVDDVLVIGIDFGTTFSGVAYATPSEFREEKISYIREWPGCGSEEGKAPTELLYDEGKILWGYAIPRDAVPISWFKLLILRDEDVEESVRSSEFFLRAKKSIRAQGLRPVDLVADYLRLLWAHTMEMIEKSRGPDFLPALRFHVVITVPAIWKGYARQSMEEAAHQAGLLAPRDIGKTQLSFVNEPEAAAMATLAEHKKMAQPGDVWLICDAGGGTVDLISYKISTTDPITMDEAVEGTGALCGGVLIDEGFEDMVRQRLGRRWDRLSATGIKEIMRDKWERGYKREFKKTDDPNKEYITGIPVEAFANSEVDDTSQLPHIKKGRIHFRELDLLNAFTTSFSKIDQLIDEQITKAKQHTPTVKGIILVGGLGSSPYLYQHLKERYAPARTHVLQSTGMKPRTAICRGAVYKGFLEDPRVGGGDDDDDDDGLGMKTLNIPAPIRVISTIARYSLGTKYYENFDPSRHDRSDPDYKWNADEGDYVISNMMEWYIRKGDNVSMANPVRHTWNRKVKTTFKGTLTDALFQCPSSDPPSRFDESVTPLCELKCTIDRDVSSLVDFTSADGKRKLKTLDYDLEMVPNGASMEFNFYMDGRKQASHNIKADYQ